MSKKFPSAWCLIITALFLTLKSSAETIEDNFARDPLANGWSIVGTPELFQWDPTNLNVIAHWDSSKPNSYFLRPLGTVLSKEDDFSIAFDLKLNSIAIGTDPGKPYTFQLAIGLLNLASATATNFLRGTGIDSPNLVEFDYFPDSGFGATISPTLISSNNHFASSFSIREMNTNVAFRITMNYAASNLTLTTTISSNGLPFGPIKNAVISPPFSDFRVDHFAVMSYSDAGQDPQFAGSILAQGVFDNLSLVVLPAPVRNVTGRFANGIWQVGFLSRSNWIYGLERTTNLTTWAQLPGSVAGNGTIVSLTDSNAPAKNAFYRVRAEKP